MYFNCTSYVIGQTNQLPFMIEAISILLAINVTLCDNPAFFLCQRFQQWNLNQSETGTISLKSNQSMERRTTPLLNIKLQNIVLSAIPILLYLCFIHT